MSGPFDRFGQFSLVFSTCPRLSTRPDLSMVCREAGEGVNVFVIDFQTWICAEPALSAIVKSSICHIMLLTVCHP